MTPLVWRAQLQSRVSEGSFDGGRKFALFQYYGVANLIKAGMKHGNLEVRHEFARWLVGTLPSLRPWLRANNCRDLVAMPGHAPATGELTANEWMCLLIATKLPELQFHRGALTRTAVVKSFWRDGVRPGVARHRETLHFVGQRPRTPQPFAVLLFDDQYTSGETSSAASQVIEGATGATVLGLYLTRSRAPLAANPAIKRDATSAVPQFVSDLALGAPPSRGWRIPSVAPPQSPLQPVHAVSTQIQTIPRGRRTTPAKLRQERRAQVRETPSVGAEAIASASASSAEVPLREVFVRGWSWVILLSEWVAQATEPHRLGMGRGIHAEKMEDHRLFGGRYYWLYRGVVCSTTDALQPREVTALWPPKSRTTAPPLAWVQPRQEATGAGAMHTARAIEIIGLLARGIDPWTGEQLEADHTLQHPDAIRALDAAIEALREEGAPAKAGSPGRSRPSSRGQNSGLPWSDDDHQRLLHDHDAGVPRRELASVMGRSELAITSRLVKFGRLDATEIQGLVPNAIPKDAVTR